MSKTFTLEEVKELVNKQAENEKIWFIAETVTEVYLQIHLRELHTAIENMELEESS